MPDYYTHIVEKRPFKAPNGRTYYEFFTQQDLDREANNKRRKEYTMLCHDMINRMAKFCKENNIPCERKHGPYLELLNKEQIPLLLNEFGYTHLTYDTLSGIETYDAQFPIEVLDTEGWKILEKFKEEDK